jgi:hypothetical protein
VESISTGTEGERGLRDCRRLIAWAQIDGNSPAATAPELARKIVLIPESAVEGISKHERGAIRSAMLTTDLEQRRHGTVQVHRSFPLCHPVVVDLDIRPRIPTHEGPLRGCSLLASLRKGRLPFFMPSPTPESRLIRRVPLHPIQNDPIGFLRRLPEKSVGLSVENF